MLERNPFANRRLQAPRVKRRVIPSYTRDELEAIVLACQKHDDLNALRDTAIVFLLVDTGIRATELCGIRLGDVERGRIKVLGKGAKERYAPLSPGTERTIRDYVRKERRTAKDDHLFVNRSGEPFQRNSLYLLVKRHALQAGLQKGGLHKFRHTFALNWAETSGPLHGMQAILGHESPTMSLRYGRMAGAQTANLHREHSPVERLGLRAPKGRKRN